MQSVYNLITVSEVDADLVYMNFTDESESLEKGGKDNTTQCYSQPI